MNRMSSSIRVGVALLSLGAAGCGAPSEQAGTEAAESSGSSTTEPVDGTSSTGADATSSSSSTEGPDESTGASSSSGETGDSTSTSSGDCADVDPGDEREHLVLSSCGVREACEELETHFEPSPWSAARCNAALSTDPTRTGYTVERLSVGPGDYTESIHRFYLSEDRVLIQSRAASCGVIGPWGPHMLCDLTYEPDDTIACAEDYEGDLTCALELFPDFATNCVEVPDWTCEETEAAMLIMSGS